MSKTAAELDHRNITNVITVQHHVFVDDEEVEATSTGLLQGIMHAGDRIYLLVGAQQVGVLSTAAVTIHSTYVGSQSAEIMEVVREATAEAVAE